MTGDTVLKPIPLTSSAFAAYGDVIETAGARHFPINAGAIERFHDLARVDIKPGQSDTANTLISIFKCSTPAVSPHRVEVIERHPLGSQALIPLAPAKMIIVVAPPGEHGDDPPLAAFVSDGVQGVNYAPGVWHMPLIALGTGQEFLVIDRGGDDNCDLFRLHAQPGVVVTF